MNATRHIGITFADGDRVVDVNSTGYEIELSQKQHRRQAVDPVVGSWTDANQLKLIHAQLTANLTKPKPANSAPT